MAERVVIAELDINAEAFIKSTSEIKKQIDVLKKEQKELTKIVGGSASKAYVQNAADLKVLGQAYNANVKTLAENTKATADNISRQALLSGALLEEVNSIKEARNQNKLLNKLRNETNVSTEQGKKELKALNDALDSNNEFIKENADAYLKQKINVGNYTESIKEAFNELNIFNGGLSGMISRSEEAGGAGNFLKQSLTGAAKGFIGLTKASLAFIATPIGAVIAALVAAFALIKNAMNRSEESTNKLKLAFSAVTGVFNTVLKALEPIGEFLIDGIVMGFNLAAEAAEKAMGIISSGLSLLGFDEAAASVTSWTEEIKSGVKAAKDLEAAEQALEKMQRSTSLAVKQLMIDQEDLRQIRDDESLSFAERQAANDALAESLKEQQRLELATAQVALEAAQLRIVADGETKDAKDGVVAAQLELLDIQERINGIESEQLTNRVALQRDAASVAQELGNKAIAQQEAELNKYIQSQGIRKKELGDQLAFETEVFNKQKELLDASLKNRNITQTEYDAELLTLQNELAQSRVDLTIENAQIELDAYINSNQGKLDSDKFFSDESLRLEQERLDGITEKQKVFAEQQLADGVLNTTEYNAAINEIDEENRLKKEEADILREEAKKEKDIIDLENKRILDQEKADFDLEFQLANLELKKQQELENADATGADKALIEDKYGKQEEKIRLAVAQNKMQIASDSLGNLLTVLGKESAAGKAVAVAQATIDTIRGGISAVTGMIDAIPGPVGIALGAVAGAAVLASGYANVKKIVSTKPKLEKGGIVGIDGSRHAQGGVPIYAGNQYVGEAEGGEGIGVLNRGAYASFMDFNNSVGGGTSSKGFYEGGGIITRSIPDGDQSTAELLNAIQTMPPPIVTVEDIQRENSSYVEVESGANV